MRLLILLTHPISPAQTGPLLRALEQEEEIPKEEGQYSRGLRSPLVRQELTTVTSSSGQSSGVWEIFRTFLTNTVFKNSTRTNFQAREQTPTKNLSTELMPSEGESSQSTGTLSKHPPFCSFSRPCNLSMCLF